jgi:DNA-binding transcriptional LysR family regulator
MSLNLRTIDLNLLTVFDAIYTEGNLGRAARRLAMTQPAVSNALSRLRAMADDPLFVRASRGVAPTPYAQNLHEPVSDALDLIRRGLAGAKNFDARTSDREFRIATGYGMEVVFGPQFLDWVHARAPHVRIAGRLIGHRESVWTELRDGVLDAVVDVVLPTASDFDVQKLMDADVAVVARRGHPRVRNALTLEAYLAERHVVLRPKSPEELKLSVRQKLHELDRDVALEVSSTLALAVVVSESNALGVMGRALATKLADKLRLNVFPPPVKLPDATVHLVWHSSRNKDPGHRWLRKGIESVFADARARLRG